MAKPQVNLSRNFVESKVGMYALLQMRNGPIYGAQLAAKIEERTNGRWRPPPGTIYPALRRLEQRGWVRTREVEGRKFYYRTSSGTYALRAYRRYLRGLRRGPPDPTIPLYREFIKSGRLEESLVNEARWLLKGVAAELSSPRSVLSRRAKVMLARRLRREFDTVLKGPRGGRN